MTTNPALKTQPVGNYAHLEPLPDPPRTYDMQQNERLFGFDSCLRLHLAHRGDVLISGGGYLRNDPTNDAERLAPDCVVAFGVDPDSIVERNGYVISEVGKPPDFVLEVASRATGRRDYTVKREGCSRPRNRRVPAHSTGVEGPRRRCGGRGPSAAGTAPAPATIRIAGL